MHVASSHCLTCPSCARCGATKQTSYRQHRPNQLTATATACASLFVTCAINALRSASQAALSCFQMVTCTAQVETTTTPPTRGGRGMDIETNEDGSVKPNTAAAAAAAAAQTVLNGTGHPPPYQDFGFFAPVLEDQVAFSQQGVVLLL